MRVAVYLASGLTGAWPSHQGNIGNTYTDLYSDKTRLRLASIYIYIYIVLPINKYTLNNFYERKFSSKNKILSFLVEHYSVKGISLVTIQ